MDGNRNLIEFWREFLAAAAEGQKVMENLTAWMRNGLSGAGEIAAAVQKTCGVDPVTKSALDYYGFWEKAQQDYRRSVVNYLGVIGFVPRDDHLSLIRKYESLKEKVVSQQETIDHLRVLISEEKQGRHQEMTDKVQGLARMQSEQFQKLMEALSRGFMAEESSQPEKTSQPQGKKEKKKEVIIAKAR